LIEHEAAPIAPRIYPQAPDPFTITEKMDAQQLQERRRQLSGLFSEADFVRWPASILAYVEEAYYFVPVHLALQLQQRRHFIAALDWLRNVYDYSRPVDERKIYHGLRREEALSSTFARAGRWLLTRSTFTPPRAIRASTYTALPCSLWYAALLD
jgi:hypothetical protein